MRNSGLEEAQAEIKIAQRNINLEPVCCSMSSSNSCFLTCIQVSQEADQVVWYSHLLKNFPQFIVIHTVKGFGTVNKVKVDVFLELSCFLMIQWMLAIWSLVSLPFLNPAWTSGTSWLTYCWSLTWRILSITLLACEMNAILHSFSSHGVYILVGEAGRKVNTGTYNSR